MRKGSPARRGFASGRASLAAVVLVVAAALPGVVHAAATWITHPAAIEADAARRAVALQFRRELTLSSRPSAFRVQVSADNRFVLRVNGTRVAAGPARGDLSHWRYEDVDLAPYLAGGRNVIAAQVWNDAASAPFAQVSSRHTGFWLSPVDPSLEVQVASSAAWQVRIDPSRSVEPAMARIRKSVGPAFYAAGPPETIDGALLAPDWNAAVPEVAQQWQAAVPAISGATLPWTLVPDALPPMRREPVRGIRLARAQGMAAARFPGQAITIAPHAEVALLLDMGRVLAAYPALTVSGGAGSQVELTYAEALYDADARLPDTADTGRVRLADRAAVGNGVVLGLTDTFKPGGAANASFEPFWWRTGRFVEIRVRTADAPLVLNDFRALETGYPLLEKGWFHSDDAELDAIWKTGLATARVDAHETYMDSAYWEQLQYIGDTRIQMLLSYDVAGDARLAEQALQAFDDSRHGVQLPESAYPNVFHQIIPPFALLWIGSLHDYWMYQPNRSLLLRTLPGSRAVLDEFARFVRDDGLLGAMPGWPFVDWVQGLDGWADREHGMLSCIVTMQYYGALVEAADIEGDVGDKARAQQYGSQAARVKDGINTQCWDEQRGLYADTPAKASFSQHGAALAVLYDIAPKDRHEALIDRVTVRHGGLDAPAGITATSYYFSFYLAQAMQHAGLADRYTELLGPWRDMLHRHFTTWPEKPDPSRSDTHAWAAHPTTGLTSYVAGIGPSAPGYARVRIEPHLGALRRVDAAVAHPAGLIKASYSVRGGETAVRIELPPGLGGTFSMSGQERELHPGRNGFVILNPGPGQGVER